MLRYVLRKKKEKMELPVCPEQKKRAKNGTTGMSFFSKNTQKMALMSDG
jgi:hypothetical protein